MSDLEEGQLSGDDLCEEDVCAGTDDDGSGEEQVSMQRLALPVADFTPDFTPHSVPTTGQEYLALVRSQRGSLPRVVSAPTRPSRGNVVPAEKPRQAEFSREQVDAALEYHRQHRAPSHGLADGQVLRQICEALRDGQPDQAVRLLCALDSRLTASQFSLLRSLAQRPDCPPTFRIIVAHRFGQSDL